MRFLHLFLTLCCCLATVGCSVDVSFPREITITQELMPLQGITDPIDLEVKHPFLMIQNNHRDDSLFHIYHLTNQELKYAFGIKGRGPGEFVYPQILKSQLTDFLIRSNDILYQYGVNEDGIPVFKGIIEPNYSYNLSEAAFINDTLFVVDGKDIAPSLYLFALQDELPRKTRQYRGPAYLIDPNSGSVYANESRVALCYRYKKQIDFMDTDLNLIKQVKFKYSPTAINGDSDDIASYMVGYFGRRYLYALFIGKSWREFRSLSSDSGVFLEVFDLDGNPVIRYRLKGLSPSYFVVDEETFTLYGTRSGIAPDDYLLMYQLIGL